MREKRAKLRYAGAAILAAAALTACGDDPTGVSMGTMNATVADGSAPAGAPYAQQSAQPAGSESASSYQGQASGSAQVQIYSEAQGWVELGAPANVTMTLQSSDETTVHTSASVPVGTYTRVRLVLDGFQASVNGGAVFGGVTVSTAFNVMLGGSDSRVTIEKEVTPFTVTAEGSAAVRFDLNTELWMSEEKADSETASDSEVEEATEAEASDSEMY